MIGLNARRSFQGLSRLGSFFGIFLNWAVCVCVYNRLACTFFSGL